MAHGHDQQLLELFKSGHMFTASHILISNQKEVRELLGSNWSTVVPMLEVKIGKYLKEHLNEREVLLREEALSYYLISESPEKNPSILRQSLAVLFQHIFSSDPSLRKLQLTCFSFAVTPKKENNIHSIKQQLFSRHDSDGWGMTIDAENFSKYCAPDNDFGLLGEISYLRYECDQLLTQAQSAGKSNEEVYEDRAALTPLIEATNSVLRHIAEPNVAKETKDVPVKSNERIIPEPPPQTITPLEKELKNTVGDNCELVYFPIWDVNQQVVNSYRASIVRTKKDRPLEFYAGEDTKLASHKIDNLVLKKVIDDLTVWAGDHDETCSFILPIHLNTLQSSSSFSPISLALKALSIVERKCLKIEIIGITTHTKFGAIQKHILKLKGYCNEIGLRVANATQASPALTKAGIASVGFHLDDPAFKPKNISEEINQLNINTEKSHLKAFIYGVDNVAMAATSIGAGVEFISGYAVGNALDMPWGTLPFKVESLYSRLLSS